MRLDIHARAHNRNRGHAGDKCREVVVVRVESKPFAEEELAKLLTTAKVLEYVVVKTRACNEQEGG